MPTVKKLSCVMNDANNKAMLFSTCAANIKNKT